MRPTRFLVAALLAAVATTAKSQPEQRLLAPYVEGSSVYSVRDLASDISPSIGKLASATVAEQLRAAISARYVRDGYITPIVRIPAEDLGSATPRLYIFEARIADIVIRGNPGPYRGRIFATLKLLRSGALRKDALRQALLRINELPGITTRAIFEPQPGMPNEFVVVLDTSYKAISGELDINNGGTSQLGNALYAGSLFFNGLLGAGEQIRLRAATSSMVDHYQFVDGRIQAAAGASELYLEVAHSEAVPDPSYHFADRSATAGIDRPMMKLASGSLNLVLWVHADDNDIHDASKIHLTDDQIRSAAVGLQYSQPQSASPLSMYSTVVHGAKLLGADSLYAADSEVQIAFTKYLLGMAQSVSFGPSWRMRVNIDAQASSDVLPIVERFAFGGLGLGEAFDPASLVGDSGAAAGVEIGRALGIHMNSLQSATVFARADYGVAWNNASYLPGRDAAASLSLGVLGKWPHALAIVELSTPVLQPTYAPSASPVRALASVAFTF